VVGGETTVTVRGRGRGGRNHELALAAALGLEGLDSCAVLAAGTDGIDGMTEAAGAVVDPLSASRMRAAGIDPVAALSDNDSGPALEASRDTITTGPTGTNVCDITMLLLGGDD
jgi:hydroxypyruvate reductase